MMTRVGKGGGRYRSVVMGWGLLVACSSLLHGQTHQGVELVQARLIADSETIVAGRPVTLGLHLKQAPGWHTYWEFSGDAGLPTSLDLDLPEGFRATVIQWPLPEVFFEEGGIQTYGYKDEVLLMVRLFPPAGLEGTEVEITGLAEWLVCEKICLPGDAKVSLRLTVSGALEPANQELFRRFQEKLPQPLRGRPDEEVEVNWERQGRQLVLNVTGPEGRHYEFFPLPPDGVVLGNPDKAAPASGETQRIRIPVTSAPAGLARVPGVLVVKEPDSGERRGWRLQ